MSFFPQKFDDLQVPDWIGKKKYRFYQYRDACMGLGDDGTLCYIAANSIEEAWEKIISFGKWSSTPHMVGNIEEIKEFKQPDPIPII